jgi:hypothetical protein
VANTTKHIGHTRVARPLMALLLAAGLLLVLTACMGGWFTQQQNATLVIGKPVVSGGRGEVMISVTDMPNQGLASIAIDDLGITYNDIDSASIETEGLNGFTVLAQDFTTTAGKGRLVAANPTSGSVGGTIIKITFEVTGANAAFGIADADKGKVELGSHLGTLITTWDLSSSTADYYAR